MICPDCGVPTHQYEKLGGGHSFTDEYEIWTMQQCPECKKFAIEVYYTAWVHNPDIIPKLTLTNKE